jgi:hypothetical protein
MNSGSPSRSVLDGIREEDTREIVAECTPAIPAKIAGSRQAIIADHDFQAWLFPRFPTLSQPLPLWHESCCSQAGSKLELSGTS